MNDFIISYGLKLHGKERAFLHMRNDDRAQTLDTLLTHFNEAMVEKDG